jgi:hypothetical protein
VTVSTHLAPPEPRPESSSSADWVATLLPPVLILVMFIGFVRLMRRANANSEEAMRLYREMLTELRAIREALAPASTTKGQPPQPPQREHTLSGQTLETR